VTAVAARTFPTAPAEPEPSPRSDGGRIPSLDGLRAISIAFVVLSHLFEAGREPALPLSWQGPLGGLGVRIFFVISGYLITTLLLREQASVGTISLTGFYARRTVRIFPACYLYVAVVAMLAATHVIVLNPHDLAHALTYTMSYASAPSWWVGHLWSLSYEEQFYLLWPGVLALAGRRWAERVAWAAVLGPTLFRGLWWAFFPAHRLVLEHAFPTAIDALATGCLCALRSEAWAPRARRWGGGPLWAFALGAVALVLIPQDALPVLVRRPFRFAFNTALNAAIASWMLGSVYGAPDLMVRLLNLGLMRRLGTISYSLYLWQQLFVGFRRLGPLPVVTASLAAAGASYLFVERPLLRLRRRLRPGGG
jgi:peptidoglycan/LPS O-acetylase OafA/YrhL